MTRSVGKDCPYVVVVRHELLLVIPCICAGLIKQQPLLPLCQDPLIFRRKRCKGSLVDYAEEEFAVRRFLDKIHPVREGICPRSSGFIWR